MLVTGSRALGLDFEYHRQQTYHERDCMKAENRQLARRGIVPGWSSWRCYWCHQPAAGSHQPGTSHHPNRASPTAAWWRMLHGGDAHCLDEHTQVATQPASASMPQDNLRSNKFTATGTPRRKSSALSPVRREA